MAASSRLTHSGSSGTDVRPCRPATSATARAVSAIPASVAATFTFGSSACGSNRNPPGCGGSAGSVVTRLPASTVSVIGCCRPHWWVPPVERSDTTTSVTRPSTVSGTVIHRSSRPVASAGHESTTVSPTVTDTRPPSVVGSGV